MPRPNQPVFSQGDNGAGAAPTIPQNGSMRAVVPPEVRSQGLYPMGSAEQAQQAMMNVLMQMGYSPFETNPFMSAMLRTAPGLQSLWQLSNLGATTSGMAGNGGPNQMFGDFLRGQLQNGSAFSSLQGGMNNFGGYVGQLRDLQRRLTAGQVDPTQVPPMFDDLESALNSPNGFSSILGSMAQPLLGSLGQSYQRGLAGVAQGANFRYLDPTTNPNFGQPGNSFLDVIMRR